MKFKREKITCNRIVDVVRDALVLQVDVCDGKAIPHIIIDTEEFPEINNSIRLHKEVDEGKITFTWGVTQDRKNVFLVVNSISPVELSYIANFELDKYVAVINRILSAQMIYIQAGKPGDKLRDNMNVPKILVEVPHTGFEVEWESVINKHLK